MAQQFPAARLLLNGEAAHNAEIIVLATPWQSTEEAIRTCGDLDGKTIIDCSNPLKPDFSGLEIGFSISGAERISEWASGARVFKAMNQIGARLMDAPHFPGIVKPVMFVCGEGPLKSSVILLVDQLGFAVIDAGELKIARLLAHSLVLLPVSRSPRAFRLGADSAVDLIFSKAQKRSRQVIFA